MQTLLYVIAAYGLFFFFVQRRQFDFVSTGFVSQLIYFLPGFYGYALNPYYPGSIPSIPISEAAYLIWIMALLATLATGMIYRPGQDKGWLPLQTSAGFDLVLMAVIIFSLAAELYVGGGAFLSADKFEVLEKSTRFSLLFSASTQIGLITFVLQGKWVRLIVPALGTLFLLYAGFRNDLAIAMIAIATFVARRDGIWTFAKPRYLLPLVALAIVLFSYKGLLVSYRLGRMDIFYSYLGRENFIWSAVVGSEPFLTQSILNEVVIRDLTMPGLSVLFSLFAAIPFFTPLVGLESLPAYFDFQEQLFPNLSYGVASNIYAYFYATLGWGGIIFFILFHCYLLVLVSRWLGRARSPIVRIGLLAAGAFLAFYIHRNDLANTFSIMNRPIIALIVTWILSRYLEWPLRRRGVAVHAPSAR